MTDLFANISIGHENDWSTLEKRIIAGAQCNADAVIISKSTPALTIPQNKKYVSINSKWGNLPYIEVAKKSEIDELTVRKFNNLTEEIGIPVIWSITDTEAGHWVLENTECSNIKIHFESRNNFDLWKFCEERFGHVYVPYGGILETKKTKNWYDMDNVSVYHAAYKFPSQIEELNLQNIEILKDYSPRVGYEGRSPDIYPDCAVELKNVTYIEKYLGDEAGDLGEAVLTPERFYDLFVNLNQLEMANGK